MPLYARDKSRLEIAFVPPRAKYETCARRRVDSVLAAKDDDVDVDGNVDGGVSRVGDKVVRRSTSQIRKVGTLVRRVCRRRRAVRIGRICWTSGERVAGAWVGAGQN